MEEASKVYFSTNKLSPSNNRSPLSTTQNFDSNDWVIRQIHCIANSGKFSIDRTISEYCDEIWEVQDLSIPKGAPTPVQRIRSFPYVSNQEKLREKMNKKEVPISFMKN